MPNEGFENGLAGGLELLFFSLDLDRKLGSIEDASFLPRNVDLWFEAWFSARHH